MKYTRQTKLMFWPQQLNVLAFNKPLLVCVQIQISINLQRLIQNNSSSRFQTLFTLGTNIYKNLCHEHLIEMFVIM